MVAHSPVTFVADEFVRSITRMLLRTSLPKGISTEAEWAKVLIDTGKLRPISISFRDFLTEIARNNDWWPTTRVHSFPKSSSAETATCQPFVSRMIECISNCGGTVHRRSFF